MRARLATSASIEETGNRKRGRIYLQISFLVILRSAAFLIICFPLLRTRVSVFPVTPSRLLAVVGWFCFPLHH
jgi:hypothetical protein